MAYTDVGLRVDPQRPLCMVQGARPTGSVLTLSRLSGTAMMSLLRRASVSIANGLVTD